MIFRTTGFEVDVSCWEELNNAVTERPEDTEMICELFIESINTILLVDEGIMRYLIQDHKASEYLSEYIDIFDTIRENLIYLLKDQQEHLSKNKFASINDLNLALKYSAYPAELITFGNHMAATAENGNLSPAHMDEAKVVTDSGKGLVKRYFGHKVVESVLSGLNEVLSIVRGHL